MAADLRTQAELEAAVGQFLQCPRRHGGDEWTAGEGDGHGGAQAHAAGCRGRHGEHLERIVLGFLHEKPPVAERVHGAGIFCNGVEVERCLGRREPWIQLAQRQKGLGFHVGFLVPVNAVKAGRV